MAQIVINIEPCRHDDQPRVLYTAGVAAFYVNEDGKVSFVAEGDVGSIMPLMIPLLSKIKLS